MLKIKFICSAFVTLISFVSMFYGAFTDQYYLAYISFLSFAGWGYHAADDFQAARTIHNLAKKYEQYDPVSNPNV